MLLDLMNALFSDMITIIILTSIMLMMTTTIVIVINPHHPDLSTTITLTNVHVGVFCIPTKNEEIHHQSVGSPRMGCYADREYARDRGDAIFRIFGRKSLMEHIRPAGSDFYMRSTSSDFYQVFSCWIITVSHFDPNCFENTMHLKMSFLWVVFGFQTFQIFCNIYQSFEPAGCFYRTRSKKGMVWTCLRPKINQNACFW